jgi:hypothetical protein
MIIRVKIHLLDRARLCSSSTLSSNRPQYHNRPRDRKIQRNILVGANKTTMTKLKWEIERNDGIADSTHQKGRMQWVGQNKWRIVGR